MEFPAVNGHTYSWSSVEISIGGDISPLIKEIKYKNKRSRGLGRGASGGKKLRTKGEDEPDGSIVFFEEGWILFLNKMGDGFQDKEIEIVVSYAEDGKPTVTDTLKRVLIDSIEGGGSEGSDPTVKSCDLNIIDILWNGKRSRAVPATT